MKVFLDEKKFLDLTIKNYNKINKDIELETLRGIILEFLNTLSELPVYNPKTGLYNMISIFTDEYVFNFALYWFGITFNMAVELPNYMLSATKKIKLKVK